MSNPFDLSNFLIDIKKEEKNQKDPPLDETVLSPEDEVRLIREDADCDPKIDGAMVRDAEENLNAMRREVGNDRAFDLIARSAELNAKNSKHYFDLMLDGVDEYLSFKVKLEGRMQKFKEQMKSDWEKSIRSEDAENILDSGSSYVKDVFDKLCMIAGSTSSKNGFWDDDPRVVCETLGMSDEWVRQFEIHYKMMKYSLFVTEVAEGVEAIRKNIGTSEHGMPAEAEELADVIIRIMDYANRYDLDLGSIIIRKLKYNMSRPYKHGKEC